MCLDGWPSEIPYSHHRSQLRWSTQLSPAYAWEVRWLNAGPGRLAGDVDDSDNYCNFWNGVLAACG